MNPLIGLPCEYSDHTGDHYGRIVWHEDTNIIIQTFVGELKLTNIDNVLIDIEIDDYVLCCDGSKRFTLNGFYHRIDGPAIYHANNSEENRYYIYGFAYKTVEEFLDALDGAQLEEAIFNMDQL
jgi:hypothetical protein